MGSRPDGWWRDRAGAARRLYEQLVQLAAEEGDDVVLVLEGKAKAGVDERGEPVKVLHARGNGDDAIVEWLQSEQDPLRWTVVTADRELRARVEALGAQVMGPRTLLDRFAAP